LPAETDLPEALRAAVRAYGDGRAAGLAAKARDLSRHYRAGGTSTVGIDFGAYLTARLPATYAAIAKVLAVLRAARPDFEPRSMLDAGAGPATASWAAAAIWPEIGAFILLDNNPAFLALARQLARDSGIPALTAAQSILGSMERISPKAELAVAAFALAELPLERIADAALSLWTVAEDTLVLVEPGTPAGFARIAAARTSVIGAGAFPVAPCPHSGGCPMVGPGWCHFAARLPRSRGHMHAKQASVPFEDEKFSYLIVARQPQSLPAARIIARPRHSKAGIRFTLCTPEGLKEQTIASRDRQTHKAYRKRGWGDAL
jgi:ribosomal protein RSM22 (predicted rRNA methylase)